MIDYSHMNNALIKMHGTTCYIDGIAIDGIFHEQSEPMVNGPGDARIPRFTLMVRTSDLAKHGKQSHNTVAIAGKCFRITRRVPDIGDITTLILGKEVNA